MRNPDEKTAHPRGKKSPPKPSLPRHEELFRTLIENSTDLISILDVEGVVHYESPSITRLMGYTQDELLGRLGFEYIHPEDLALARESFRQALIDAPSGSPVQLRMLHKDGRWLPFEIAANVLLEHGHVVGLVTNARDLSDRVRAQQDLVMSEQRFRSMVENSFDMLGVIDPEGRVVYQSPANTRMTGYTMDEIRGRDIFTHVHPDDEARIRATFKRLLAHEGAKAIMEFRYRRKDGTYLMLETIGSNRLNDPAIRGVIVNARDITDRRRAEDALRQSEQRLALHVKETPLGAIEWNAKFEVVEWNTAAEAIFGYRREQALGKHASFIIPEHARAHVDGVWEKLLSRQGGVRSLNQNLTQKGDLITCEWYNTPLFDKSGAIIGAASLVQDVTERQQAEAALRESEAKFRAVAETATSAIYIHQGERILYVNQACETISGFSREELLAMSPWELVHPDDRETTRNRFFNRQKGLPTPSHYEFRILTRSGESRWLDFSASPLIFEGQQAILATAFDITERKRTEQLQAALYRIAEQTSYARDLDEFYRAMHELLEELMQARNFYIALHDPHSGLISFSYYADEEDPKPEPRRPGKGLTEYVLRTGKPYLNTAETEKELARTGEVELVGTPSIDWLGVPLKDGDVTFGVLVVQSYDEKVRFGEREKELLTFVSQHVAGAIQLKRGQQALRESEARTRSLVESAVYGIYRSSVDNCFLDVNPALVAMLGYDNPAEVLALDLAAEVYANGADRERLIQKYRNSGRVENEEVRWKRRDGHGIIVRLNGRAVRNQTTGDVTFEMIAEDVTERRQLEEQLRQSQKMEAVGRLAGGIAHDFNNLLTVIKGYSELMLEQLKTGDPVRVEVEEVKKAADRAVTLTRQLLAFSRRQVLEPKVLDLNAVVLNLERLLRRLLGEDVELSLDLTQELGRVKTDPGQLEQVIMNLAVNARDAMPQGGKLSIRTRNVELQASSAHTAEYTVKPGPYVLLETSDSGMGMDKETALRVFEPFFTTKEPGKGTGLGLSTVYGIVKQSGGYVWVESEPGRGATFKVFLPQVDEELEVVSDSAPGRREHAGSETILLVEDEDGVRALIHQILEKQGYRVLEAQHGGEALLLCERHPEKIHLLLTDVVLSRMNGRELAQRLLAVRGEMKVLFMSGYSEDAIVQHGVLDPGTYFLQKPFTTDALTKRVREILDAPAVKAVASD